MINTLIPPQYRLAARLTLAVVVCLACAWGGARIALWRAEAGFAEERDGYTSEIANLKLAVANQNGRVQALSDVAKVADAARLQAEVRAAEAAKRTGSRVAKVDAIKATSCDVVITEYWSIRQ